MSNKQVATACVCAPLVLLFLYAGINQFVDSKTFTDQLINQPFPHYLTRFLVWWIPSMEIAVSIALLFERTRRLGLYASLILLSVFTFYSGIVVLRLLPYVPACCGAIHQLTWTQQLVLNFFSLDLSILGIALQRPKSLHVAFIHK